MDKEKWTEDILSSLEEIKIVQPRADLYTDILEKIQEKETAIIPLYWVSSIAASFLLLIALNVNFLFNSNQELSTTENVLSAEFDNTNSNQLYLE